MLAMRLSLDPYITDTLMRDFLGHDRAPSAFALYLWLWRHTRAIGKPADRREPAGDGFGNGAVEIERAECAETTQSGASSSPCAEAVPTQACHYEVLEPWKGR